MNHLIKFGWTLALVLLLTLALRSSTFAALQSERGPALTPQTKPAAGASSQYWSALPNNGLNAAVTELAVIGSDLYAAGDFTVTADGAVKNLNYIARFSGGTWSPLPNKGLNGLVRSLAVMGSDLYVGGAFTETADGAVKNLNRVAKLSGGTWSALPSNGLNGGVSALAVMGDDLYAGGGFTQTADGAVSLNHIAKLSGGVWSSLPNNGLNNPYFFGSPIFELEVMGNDLYVGGAFSATADGAVQDLNYIAKLSGGTWSALPNKGLDYIPRTMTVIENELYVGGGFFQTGDEAVNLNHIAKLSGGAWATFPNGGLDVGVNAITLHGNALYAGGEFTRTADGSVTNLNHIAKLSGGTWSALPGKGFWCCVYALAEQGGNLYAAGSFNQTYDGGGTNLNNIAMLKECTTLPDKPLPLLPNGSVSETKVKLVWSAGTCALYYKLKIKDLTTDTKLFPIKDIGRSKYKLRNLVHGHAYQWQVSACNEQGCRKGPKAEFEIAP